MQRFRYCGIDENGEPARGEAMAGSPEQATALLANQGIEVTEIKPQKSFTAFGLRRGATSAEIAQFCEQLAGLVESDLPLPDALKALCRDATGPRLREALSRVADGLEQGMSLGELLEAEKQVFPPLLPALIEAGEESGKLPEILRLVATHSWRMDALRRQVAGAMIYPLFVLGLLGAIVCWFFLVMLPGFESFYSGMNIDLPAVTGWLLDISHNFWTVAGIAGIGFAVIIYLVYAKDDIVACISFKRWLLFHTPLLGRVLKASYLCRFCRFMELLLPTGVSLERAFVLLERIDSKVVSPRGISLMTHALERGASLSEAMRLRLHAFPELLVWMVSACEGTDRLPKVFGEMAQIYEDETKRGIWMLQVIAMPVCLVILGLVVFLVVIGMFIPFYGLFYSLCF